MALANGQTNNHKQLHVLQPHASQAQLNLQINCGRLLNAHKH